MQWSRTLFAAVVIAGLSGCSSETANQANQATDAAGPAESQNYGEKQLTSALMDKVDGMQKAFGPKAGAYGELYSNQADAQGQTKPKLNKPHCGQVGKLDETAEEVTKAPSAVIAFRGQQESLSQALVSLPESRAGEPFTKGLPKDCGSYRATVGGKTFKYATKPLDVSVGGDDSLAYVTRAKGENGAVDFGVVTVRHGNVLMTLVSTGTKISPGLFQKRAEDAFAKVRTALT